MLELVLAFGNYMNRGQRGNAVGFKIGSLGKIHDTKSSVEKRTTLLHYLVDIVERKVKNGQLIGLFIIAKSKGLFMTIANCVLSLVSFQICCNLKKRFQMWEQQLKSSKQMLFDKKCHMISDLIHTIVSFT